MLKIYQKLNIYLQASGTDSENDLFDYIWKNYSQRISFFISNLVPADHLYFDDLYQDIMLKIYNNLHLFNPKYSLDTWIYRISRNHCIDFIKTSKETIEFDCGSHTDCKNGTPENIAIREEIFSSIDNSINNLDLNDRQIAYFRFYEKMKYGEISRIMEININTVKTRVRHIRKKLREELRHLL